MYEGLCVFLIDIIRGDKYGTPGVSMGWGSRPYLFPQEMKRQGDA